MKAAGIDARSRTVKLAVIENNRLIASRKSPTSCDSSDAARALGNGLGGHALHSPAIVSLSVALLKGIGLSGDERRRFL